MTSKTIDTIEENIKFAIIDYIRFIVEERQHVINLYGLNIHVEDGDMSSECLIYETLFRDEDYGFEIFCKENGYFCEDDFEIITEYITYALGYYTNLNCNMKIVREFYWILGVCVNTYYNKNMTYNNEFIDIWNELNNSLVRNNILK
jgi:hypothetical protein